jgi:hypothetical protein
VPSTSRPKRLFGKLAHSQGWRDPWSSCWVTREGDDESAFEVLVKRGIAGSSTPTCRSDAYGAGPAPVAF